MEILGTTETSYYLESLIKEANDFLVIVSPYLNINVRLKIELEDCFNRCKKCIIAFRENKLLKEEYQWLERHKNLELVAINNLHAKCYINETTAIISSMNLYEYSQINNHEIGVMVSAKKHVHQYNKLFEKLSVIFRSSTTKTSFEEINNSAGYYTMGDLVVELNSKFIFNVPKMGLDSNYLYLCSEAKKIMRFAKNELYEDGTKILRSTNLGKVRFDILYKDLSKLGTRK